MFSVSETPNLRSCTAKMSPAKCLALKTNGDYIQENYRTIGDHKLLLMSSHEDSLTLGQSAKYQFESAKTICIRNPPTHLKTLAKVAGNTNRCHYWCHFGTLLLTCQSRWGLPTPTPQPQLHHRRQECSGYTETTTCVLSSGGQGGLHFWTPWDKYYTRRLFKTGRCS